MELFLNGLGPARALHPEQMTLALLCAFLLGSLLAACYRWTHQGVSYSRSFVQTMVLASVVAAIMIVVIGNNLARGLGIIGALAIIRFRTPIRDPRDIIFLFAALAVGIASGAQLYLIGAIGAAFFVAAALFLSWSPFTSRREFEGLLRYVLPKGGATAEQVREVLEQYTAALELISLRDAAQGDCMEYAYQIRLLDPSYKHDLLEALEAVPGIRDVSLLMQRATVEI